ncbi:DUF4304 domain-containing protein [Undibacterium sp. Ji83W]|uniref:DUF4304 domain-containing protein n=1 Tax=Undibacterium sp. Ji83W TaxID=3413043 RepID=UPI003BF3D802
MARVLSPPQDDDKIGKKIDYVAKLLGLSLAPQGYARKGRDLVAAIGDDPDMSWLIINLQGNKWNEGAYGAFFVNLSVQFPCVCREVSKIQSYEWIADCAEKPHEASGQYRERLEGVLPRKLFRGFFSENEIVATDLAKHREINIKSGTSLDMVALQLSEAIVSYAFPWFELRSSLKVLRDGTHSAFIGPSFVDRIAAAILANDREAGNRVIAELGAKLPVAKASAIRKWIIDSGFDPSGIPVSPTEPLPSGT